MVTKQVTPNKEKKKKKIDLKIARFETSMRQLMTSLEGTQNQLAEAQEEIETLKTRLKRKNMNVGGMNFL